MGRELKRVALDFDWPKGKVWKGFINPHYKKCPEDGLTCFNGENAAAYYLLQLTEMFAVVASSALKGKTHRYCLTLPYKSEHPEFAVQPKEIRDRFVDLFKKISGSEKDPFMGFQGHDLFWKLLDLAGIERKEGPDGKNPAYEWTHCLVCHGEGVDPAVKKEYDEWKEYEPPKGDGFQLWETTSEGSPISPVFKTLDELCAWAEKKASTFGDSKTTAAQWKKMLGDGLVYHQEGNATFI